MDTTPVASLGDVFARKGTQLGSTRKPAEISVLLYSNGIEFHPREGQESVELNFCWRETAKTIITLLVGLIEMEYPTIDPSALQPLSKPHWYVGEGWLKDLGITHLPGRYRTLPEIGRAHV